MSSSRRSLLWGFICFFKPKLFWLLWLAILLNCSPLMNRFSSDSCDYFLSRAMTWNPWKEIWVKYSPNWPDYAKISKDFQATALQQLRETTLAGSYGEGTASNLIRNIISLWKQDLLFPRTNYSSTGGNLIATRLLHAMLYQKSLSFA